MAMPSSLRSAQLGLIALVLAPVCSARGEEFRRHAVVAQEGHAADVGREVLRQGGNAVDAAIATAFALAVTHPAAGNLGGGGFLVAYLADTGQVVSIDFRESAPAAASPRMFMSEDGSVRPERRLGPLAAGVPGTVRGLGLAHRRLGSKSWASLIEPAEKLAREGFPVSNTLARSLNAHFFDGELPLAPGEDLGSGPNRMSRFPASVSAFRRADGLPWKEGDILTQPDLANTLSRIAIQGPDEFYLGRTASRIAAYCLANGGLITRDDLASYRAIERPPVHLRWRGIDLYAPGPPSGGGVVLALMLRMLEPVDLESLPAAGPELVHRVAEVQRRAFATRVALLGDPDQVDVPLAALLGDGFVRHLSASIGTCATPSDSLVSWPLVDRAEGDQTTHFSVLDAQGNAVALTYTLEEGYGCKAVVPGLGFLLNNEMGDFNALPGQTTRGGEVGTRANEIAPRKRMLSSQSPLIAVRDGRVVIVTGSPGGRTIPNTVLWVLLRLLVFGEAPENAVSAARTHHQWLPDVLFLEGNEWPESTRRALEERGHRVRVRGVQGNANTIVIDSRAGRIHGVADSRQLTSKASGD